MRVSEAGLALVRRLGPGGVVEYLTQWSDSWKMFALVGGHVQPGESFRQCCVREVAEELNLTLDVDYRIGEHSLYAACEYTAHSHSAGVETRYRVELFACDLLTPAAIARVNADPANRWLSEYEIRRQATADGRPVSAQVETVLRLFGVLSVADTYDLFISYAHCDNQGNPGDDLSRIKAIKLAIEREYRAMTGRDVRIFLDEDDIQTGDDWRLRILRSLQSSKLMLAVVSENYFKSAYCKLEWEHYVDTELDNALPGEGIAPIYILRYPDFDALKLDERLQRWARDLQRRQVDVRWLQWWPDGQAALEREDVCRRLRELAQQLSGRLDLYERRSQSPTNQFPQLSRHFKGRRRELHELRASLVKGHIGAITAVNGVAGIGKTELALAYAWGYGGHYPGGRFYLNLAGRFPDEAAARDALQQRVADLAPWKGVEVSDQERQTPGVVFAKVCKRFHAQPDQPALFILDNIDDAKFLQPELLAQGLPQGPHIDVILTTRLASVDQDRLAWVGIDSLETEDGVALLDSFVPIPSSPQDVEWKAAYKIAERLGGHALALNIVGVYLRWKKETYTRFLAYLETEGLELVSIMGRDIEGKKVSLGSQYQEKVLERLLAPTLDHLGRDHPAAYRALQIAALCPPDNVPLPWIERILGEVNAEWREDRLGGTESRRAIELLRGHRLLVPIRRQKAGLVVEASEDGLLVRMHRVYQDLLLRRIESADRGQMVELLRQVTMDRAKSLRECWGRSEDAWEIWPLLDFAQRFSAVESYDVMLLLTNVAETVQHVGRMGDVGRLLHRLVEIAERRSANAPANAEFARELSASYQRLGDFFRSSGDGQRVREFYEKMLVVSVCLSASAPENTDYALALSVSYDRMGDLLKSLGDCKQAREFYEKSLTVRERLSEIDPENGSCARNLSVNYRQMGDVFRAMGDIKQGREFYEKSLSVSQRLAASAPNNVDYSRALSASYDKMADIFWELGDGKQAREFCEKLLVLSERLSSGAPENADFACDLSDSYDKMGDLFRALGDGKQARQFYVKSLAVRERLSVSAPENVAYTRNLSVSYNRMGDLFRELGDGKQARRFYEQLLVLSERLAANAPENADYASDLSVGYDKMGDVFRAMGDGKQAQQLYEKSLTVCKRPSANAPENADYASDLSACYDKMGDVFQESGDSRQAREFYEKSLAVRERLFATAPDNAIYAHALGVSFERLADIAVADGQISKAVQLLQQELDIGERLMRGAPENVNYASYTSIVYSKLADLFRELGEVDQAMELYEKSLAVSKRLSASAPDNVDYARTLAANYDMLFMLHEQKNETANAIPYLRASLRITVALALRDALPNPQDQEILANRLQIAQKLKELGLWGDASDSNGVVSGGPP